MATNDVQETLDRLLEELKSNDSVRCLNAIQELNQLNFSSRAIVLQLERLALKEAGETPFLIGEIVSEKRGVRIV